MMREKGLAPGKEGENVRECVSVMMISVATEAGTCFVCILYLPRVRAVIR